MVYALCEITLARLVKACLEDSIQLKLEMEGDQWYVAKSRPGHAGMCPSNL